MILKEKDSIAPQLEQLEQLARLPNLSEQQLAKVDKEIRILKSGNSGELDSAYFIDFYFRDTPNWVVVHDFRIENNGFVAQIDHLIINRTLDIYVLETKHYANGIKVNDRGEFLVSFQKNYRSIESPIAQNHRHVKVLHSLLARENILPKRLGFTLQPNLRPYILVSPKSRIIRPQSTVFNTDMLIKADEFYKLTQDNIDNDSLLATAGAFARIVSRESLQEIGEKLLGYHQPFKIDYSTKLGISAPQEPQSAKLDPAVDRVQSKYYCYTCKNAISEKVGLFCFSNKKRFKGKAYCFECQKQLSVGSTDS